MRIASGEASSMLAAWTVAAVVLAAAPSRGEVVVESTRRGFAADRAGIRAGDVLISWEREARPPANPKPASGEIRSPMELRFVELEQAPRGIVRLHGTREGKALSVELPAAEWRLSARPILDEGARSEYEHGKALLETDAAVGREVWRRLAAGLKEAGDHPAAAWLYAELAMRASEDDSLDRARAIFAESLRLTEEAGAVLDTALLKKSFSGGLFNGDGPNVAFALQKEILETLDGEPDAALLRAETLRSLAELGRYLGKLTEADAYVREALAVVEREAPESLLGGSVLNTEAIVRFEQGNWQEGRDCLFRAREILVRAAPRSMELARALSHLSTSSMMGGQIGAADRYFDQAFLIWQLLEESTLVTAMRLSQAAAVAASRGDLMRAESFARRALEIRRELLPEGIDTAHNLVNLATLSMERGKLREAKKSLGEAIDICAEAPCGYTLVTALASYGTVAAERGDEAEARAAYARAVEWLGEAEVSSLAHAAILRLLGRIQTALGGVELAVGHFGEALAIEQKAGPGSLSEANSLRLLGEAVLAGGRLVEAEGLLRRALDTHERVAPGTMWEAASAQGVGRALRAQGKPDNALEYFVRAVESIELQSARIGGDYAARTRFAAREASLYREYLDLLVDLGRLEEAFYVTERWRARELLLLLALRDVLAGSDVPAELRARMERANRDYDAALAALASLTSATHPFSRKKILKNLGRARSDWEEARSLVHAASPRLAALETREPLDLDRALDAIDPGTLTLTYVVTRDRTHLFALGPDAGEFFHSGIPISRRKLRQRIERFRESMHPTTPAGIVAAMGRSLSDLLLAPVSAQIERAERLLIVPDHTLYGLAFAALASPGSDGRFSYLAEEKSLFYARSLTSFSDLAQRREPAVDRRVVAFGAPVYPTATTASPVDPVRGQALVDGLRLTPLPFSREEVEGLGGLFPEAAEIYLGAEATEDRAKSVAERATIVHFACHGILDEEHPMESALALSIPEEHRPESENGLLQAWEIFEQVRLESDLVTLSACDTARNGQSAGAATVGLTAAFEFAGARSVLSTLWAVGDRSGTDLMRHFYGSLRAGSTKAEALRSAQSELIAGRGADRRYAHPFYWAAFQLSGDWQ